MTLWDRVERWRSEADYMTREGLTGDATMAGCADELEADLRELRQRFEKALVSVDMIVQEDDSRALEAFDIAIGPLRS